MIHGCWIIPSARNEWQTMTTEELDSLLDSIRDGEDPLPLRVALLDRLEKSLDDHRLDLGRWEKDHLVCAISALHWNISHGRASNWWLRYCLQNIWKAEIPPGQRSEYPSERDAILDGMSVEDFKSMIQAVRARISG
jgi:hypothetical protein